MALDIKPTRSELIKLKKKIKLAKSGYNLLKKKRDGLILEFFEVLKRAKTLRQELVGEYEKALHAINIARVSDTDDSIKSLAMAIQQQPEISLKTKNIMGVKVPQIESQGIQKSMFDRGYGFVGSSAAIDEAAKAYEKVVEKVILAAEIETSMKKMLQEIEKTKRRVNALEFAVIPKMQQTEAFIKLRLEEMEREGIFRLKRIKA
ncbi:V-type ATP synthase subunit D [Candidatus Woesearchaeota archaeon CG10_big_fil_rev_8_21_14_0_10_44_13]|nr:MAG: V-type ATP synthase subunit D [Candidatus Woesearchaeota archaeon CG10_big_fil_rev_8_21_14_0_10_44_13]